MKIKFVFSDFPLMRVAAIVGILPLFLLFPTMMHAQEYDLLIKNGHVIDPKNAIDGEMDVAINDGKIARVAKNIPKSSAKKVADAKGMYVTPGFIDIHTHVFVGTKIGFAVGF